MKKVIFGVFAHPDDEAFGPCGTLLLEAQAGTEIHLITLTNGDGEKSTNPDNVTNLGDIRLQEWQRSAQLLGASSTHHLGYPDGKLGNNDLIAISHALETIVTTTTDNREDLQVEFMSFDLNGLTGHIDHIVASRSCCLAFYRLKTAGLPVKRLRLYCLSAQDYPKADTGFVFMEQGRQDNEIDETTDATELLDDIHEVMRCHASQHKDYTTHVQTLGDRIAINHFIVKE